VFNLLCLRFLVSRQFLLPPFFTVLQKSSTVCQAGPQLVSYQDHLIDRRSVETLVYCVHFRLENTFTFATTRNEDLMTNAVRSKMRDVDCRTMYIGVIRSLGRLVNLRRDRCGGADSHRADLLSGPSPTSWWRSASLARREMYPRTVSCSVYCCTGGSDFNIFA